jgi:G6PDH family F420-dependent oxidoreductase
VKLGYALSCEEFRPDELVAQARAAQEAGFSALWISDHYHPWVAEQGQSPFVWSVIGGISQVCQLPLTTAVTCPTMRIHPAIVAQAAATSAVLLDGRFTLGVGSGEALNEHILGDAWPDADTRLAMLEEAVEVIRELWEGSQVSFDGEFFTVVNARLYTLPDRPPPVFVSGFGPKAARLAGRIGDGFITTSPNRELVAAFREGGGADKPITGSLKTCWDEDRGKAAHIAHRRWPTEALPGELNQMLVTPAHFEQAAELVTEEMVAGGLPHGPDPGPYLEAIHAYAEAGFDELYLSQIGPRQAEFFDFAASRLLGEFDG